MARVLVYYTLLVVIIRCIMFVKLPKILENVVKRSEFRYTRELSAIQKLSIIIIIMVSVDVNQH